MDEQTRLLYEEQAREQTRREQQARDAAANQAVSQQAVSTQQSQEEREARERALRESITAEAQAKAIQAISQSEQMTGGQPPISRNEYYDSVKDVTAKLETLDTARQVEKSYQDQEIPYATQQKIDQIKAMVLSPVSPYINMSKGTINIKGAIRAGISDKELRDIGIRQVEIAKAKHDIANQKTLKEVDIKTEKILKERKETKEAEQQKVNKQISDESDIENIVTEYNKDIMTRPVSSEPTPEYNQAESDFNKVVDEIWSRKGLTDKEKTEIAIKTPEWQQLQNATANYNQTLEASMMSKDFVIIGAEILVPGVYVGRHWKDLSPAERSLFIAADVASLLPFVGAVTRGSRAGATFGRAVMAKNAIKEIGTEAIAQIMAPINVILHPVGTVKATGKQVLNLTENIAHPKKIPYTVLTTTDGTVRIVIDSKTTPEQAIAARNILMEESLKGKKIIAKMGEQTVEVASSPFMREVRKSGGAFAHATPSGEVFEDVLTVMKKEGMPASEQGLFFANEPLPRFTKSSAFGTVEATKPTIYIVSQETAQAMKGSNKIYRNTAELERILPVNARTTGSQQRLITRIGVNADKVQILLEKPLSARQIAKLKAEGLIEVVKAPFNPAIKYEGTEKAVGLTVDEINELSRQLRLSGNLDQARTLIRIGQTIRTVRPPARSLSSITGTTRERRIEKAEERYRNINQSRRYDMSDIPDRITGKTVESRDRTISDTEYPDRVPDIPERTSERITDNNIDRINYSDIRTPIKPTDINRPPRYPDKPVRPPRPPRFPEEPEKPIRPDMPYYSGGKSDSAIRKEIKDSGGAIAWRQGQVGGKDRWDVVVYPYRDDEHYYMLLGKKPEGATIVKKGKGSAYGTTQVVKGEAPDNEVMIDSGITDIIITPQDRNKVRMRVNPDPKQQTTGDITIGSGKISNGLKRISNNTYRITNRGRRITPKIPKLR